MENNNEEKKVILSLDKIKKYFINQGIINKAVDDVSFDVHEGEIVGLIGESGSGKTTVGRSLLRLYEDYNGFVRLNGKIVSGRKITDKRRKFLRRNIQMIFQDPHASLNGQKTIYSILKEPLVVNGIMKEKLDDIFSDWNDVKQSFKFTFQLNTMALQTQNYKEINKAARPFFSKWVKNFSNFKFDANISNEDNFINFFSYLEEKQIMESQIINNMYSNTTKLLELYYECQTKYRNNDLSAPELAFIKAKKELDKVLILAKYSPEAFEALKQAKEVKKEIATKKEYIQELVRESKNTFLNYIQEYNNEKSISNIARLSSIDLEVYIHNYKNELLFAKKAETIKSFWTKLNYLEFDLIRKLINELEEYAHKFYLDHLESINFTLDAKTKIREIIKNNFKFDVDEYIKLSSKNEKQLYKELHELKHNHRSLLNIVFEDKKNKKNKNFDEINKQIEEAKNVFKLAEEKYMENMEEYLKTYKTKIEKYYNEINELEADYKNLVDQQTFCNKKYAEYKNEFWNFLRTQIKLGDINSKKEIESIITIYKTDLFLKEESLKSFDIEKKYLEKDIKKLHLLLGIDEKWVDQNIKNAKIAKENNEHAKPWTERKNIFDSAFLKPLARFIISGLLYKTMIYKALEDVGLLKQFAYRYPHEFSGGQLQRIVIARALISSPTIVVADEPIASLDISIQAQVVNLLKELCAKKNIGLIFIAHDLSMVEYVADYIQIMHLGKIVEYGKTEQIYENPIHPYTINLFKAIPKISNSNEKFQNVSFELDYLNEQRFPNVPEFFNVGPDHYVYGTNAQVKEWTKIRKAKEVEENKGIEESDYTLIQTNKKAKTSKKTFSSKSKK